MKIMKKPGNRCGKDVLKGVDNPIKAFLAMKHRWKAEIDLDDCGLVNIYLPRSRPRTYPIEAWFLVFLSRPPAFQPSLLVHSSLYPDVESRCLVPRSLIIPQF
jgi:hypothetical protein